MNGRRSVRRCPDQQSQASQESPNEPTGSGSLQSNSWYLHNSMRNGPRTHTSSSSQMTSSTENRQQNEGEPSDREQIMFTREVIPRDSSTTTLSSSSSTLPAHKNLLRRICNIPCLMIMSIICLPQSLLNAYIYVTEHFIQEKQYKLKEQISGSVYMVNRPCDQMTTEKCMKVLKCLLVAVPVVCVAIYCSCLCMSFSDSLSSKEVAQLYETELKSLWQSHVLLEEKIHEIQVLKKETNRLGAEINSIHEGILQSVKQILEDSDIPGDNKNRVFTMINLAFKKIYEDHVQMADWAQKTIGATIDKDRTTKTYDPENVKNCWFGSFFMSSTKPPDTILQPDVYPGNCWAFEGSEGQVVVKLPEKIQPTAVTVQHISKAVSPSGGVSSALKDFLVYGIDNEDEEETLLGTFMYDTEKEAIQTFQLKNERSELFQYIKFQVRSNWGNPEFTCIYRVRVHGKMLGPLEEGKR